MDLSDHDEDIDLLDSFITTVIKKDISNKMKYSNLCGHPLKNVTAINIKGHTFCNDCYSENSNNLMHVKY